MPEVCLELKEICHQFGAIEAPENVAIVTMTAYSDEKLKDAQMKANINQTLIESGEKERLKEMLRNKLIECGWRDQLKAYCKEVVRRKGLKHVTVDDLVAEITPKGRELVPDDVKKELLHRIRAFLAQQKELSSENIPY